MNKQGDAQPDDAVDDLADHEDVQDGCVEDVPRRQPSLELRDALRAARARAAAGSDAEDELDEAAPLRHSALASLQPAMDMVRRLGLGAAGSYQSPRLALFQQQSDVISKLAMPQMDAVRRAGLGAAAFSPRHDIASSMLGMAGAAGLLPRYDIASSILGKFDTTSFLPWSTFPGLTFPGLTDLLKVLREDEPPNWAGVDFDLEVVTTVICDDGIPLVWVPRAEIVEELLAAEDRDARVAVLLARIDDLMTDCRDVLDDIEDDSLIKQKPLAVSAVDSLAAGHYQPAQALAVALTETAVTRSLGSYKKAKAEALFDPDDLHWSELRLRAALAPINSFYTPWFPNTGAPAPTALSRHVSMHQADVEHYSPGNAVVAVLLVVSVFRALQERQAAISTSTVDGEVA